MKMSTRLIRKGALIDESRVVLKEWDADLGVSDNLSRILKNNPLGAKSEAWLREVRVTLSSRFSEFSPEALTSLSIIADSPASRDVWSACLLWHTGRADKLYYRFATRWLFTAYRDGVFRIRTEDVIPFLSKMIRKVRTKSKPLSDYGTLRASRDLLRMASDFDLLKGSVVREFASYHLPEESLIYLLHVMSEHEKNARRIVNSMDWRMYLMDASDLERELLRLHQFRKLHYEVAGSLARLELPYESSATYAKEMVS